MAGKGLELKEQVPIAQYLYIPVTKNMDMIREMIGKVMQGNSCHY
jgi:hypothetical protein